MRGRVSNVRNTQQSLRARAVSTRHRYHLTGLAVRPTSAPRIAVHPIHNIAAPANAEIARSKLSSAHSAPRTSKLSSLAFFAGGIVKGPGSDAAQAQRPSELPSQKCQDGAQVSVSIPAYAPRPDVAYMHTAHVRRVLRVPRGSSSRSRSCLTWARRTRIAARRCWRRLVASCRVTVLLHDTRGAPPRDAGGVVSGAGGRFSSALVEGALFR
ncbi:hypothetical protein SVAN01_02559 [Stagonosporopsis vannaccii]|nr:hypothetical protein SVAN01_02559 [Stagonosporopsis vannaccii]